MPEYSEEYEALLQFLERHGGEHIPPGDDDSFLTRKAYPAFILADPLDPDKDINVTAMRWEIPTQKNKLLSLVYDQGSFQFLGVFVPDDEKYKSPYLIDVDAVADVIKKVPNASLTFIIANQYGASFVKAESGENTYLIPFLAEERMTGLRSGVLYNANEVVSIIDQRLPHILSGEYAYNENGEPLYGGGGASSPGSQSAAMFCLFLGIGAIICITAPFAIHKYKMRQESRKCANS
jgi:hypothetical protein